MFQIRVIFDGRHNPERTAGDARSDAAHCGEYVVTRRDAKDRSHAVLFDYKGHTRNDATCPGAEIRPSGQPYRDVLTVTEGPGP